MLNKILTTFYERDIRKLIEEVNLFNNEEDLWKIHGSIRNSAGNLVLHIIGGLNHYVGATLAQSGYIRDREQEFIRKGIARQELIIQLEQLIPLVNNTVSKLTEEDMEAEFPILYDNQNTSTSYVLVQMLVHLNYHLGQVNYLRRIL